MSKFKVGDEVIAYGKSYGIIKDLGDIGCLITFKDKTHHVQYPDIKKSPHQELLDLGWVKKYEDDNFIKYEIEDGDKIVFALGIDKNLKAFDIDTKEFYLRDWYGYPIGLQLVKILVKYLEELE